MCSKIDHVAVLVDDLKKAEEWYIKHLDATVTFKDDFYTRIQLENTCLALIDKTHYPCAHIGILVEDIKNLPLERGEIVKHRDGAIGVYVKDPFGNYLEYIWYSDKQKEVFLKDD
jgi:catechol 2,3-dioxygenase-like lactoylglutathione lyase family enzyme